MNQPTSTTGFTPVTTDEGKLQQLIEYLEEHVPAYRFMSTPVPWQGSEDEVRVARAEANTRAARLPDAIVHASMLVLGAGVNHTLPFVAFADPASLVFDETTIAGVPVTVYVPTAATGAVVVAAHGGAWWMGNGVLRENSFGPDCAALAERSGAVVVDVDYRLAPEHPMPAAAEDVSAVVNELRNAASGSAEFPAVFPEEVRVRTNLDDIVLWGVSSGGHTCVRALDFITGELPVLALTAPALDLTGYSEELLTAVFGTTDAIDPTVSPVRRTIPQGLQVLVQLGSKDDTVRGGAEFAELVNAHGGSAMVKTYLATHLVAVPAVQRDRITDLARFIVKVTQTERELPDVAVGDYDKEAIDKANEDSWDWSQQAGRYSN
ncbi:alpha/beta hydrolase [Corynebacterium sp. H113]|uniref:alpha/beta hydrolase n=1 Tax=Corynebacterium sp. H113 TaxID=3133419 RepID=UPI00309A909B